MEGGRDGRQRVKERRCGKTNNITRRKEWVKEIKGRG